MSAPNPPARPAPEQDMEPLGRLAVSLRVDGIGRPRIVPAFDPYSGGVRSRVLLLMETPGPATIAAGDGAVCSEDNPGPTAAALRRARASAGLVRESCLRWNLVPWALDHRPRREDVAEGAEALARLVALLPELRAVVAFGATALDGVMRYLTLRHDAELVPVIGVPHPSPANGRHRAEQHERAVQALRLAARAPSRDPEPRWSA